MISRSEEDEGYDSDYQDGPVPVPVAFASVTADSAFGAPQAAPPPPQGRKTGNSQWNFVFIRIIWFRFIAYLLPTPYLAHQAVR